MPAAELTTPKGGSSDVGVQTSRWLIEHLLQAEHAHRAFASVRHQMKAARFPLNRDLAGFDFEASTLDQKLVRQLNTLAFTDAAQNAVLIGGPGTGKTDLATAIGVAGIAPKGSGCVSIPRSIWSTSWSAKSVRVRPGASHWR